MAKSDKKMFKEDLEFALRAEAAWKRFKKGEFITMDFGDFMRELKKW